MYQVHPDYGFDNEHLLKTDSNYRSLWASVILQAIRDIDTCENSDRDLALDYILDDREYIGSFTWICDVLNLDSTAIRQRALTREGRTMLVGRNQGNRKPRALDHEP
jgi:hypothetical protein